MAMPNTRSNYIRRWWIRSGAGLRLSRFGFTIADTQISFGFIVDGLDTLRLEENASLDGGFFVDANTTSGVLRITYDDNETFSRLVDKLNDDTNATILAIYDDMFVYSDA